MAVAKKEDTAVEAAAHDCKADCAELHKQIAELKKEVQALQAELKKAPKGGGGADPRVEKIIEALKLKLGKGDKWQKASAGEKSDKIIESL